MNTQVLLSAPILPTVLRLSAPGVLLVLFQSMVSVGDTYFVGRLGTEPLAGLALVFPLIMLLQMTSAGAMDGGVSSAIASALGSGDAAAARKLVVHALVIAAAMIGKLGKRGDAPCDDLGIWRHAGVRNAVPGREAQALHFRGNGTPAGKGVRSTLRHIDTSV